MAATSSALPLHAATWTCYPEITNGMTGPQQITNALTRLASGDTILVKPGTYDFTGISMRTDICTNGATIYVITNHLTRNIEFTLKGDTTGHWDDAVVFKGNGRCCDLKWINKYYYFQNITFDGFDCQRFPSGGSFESRGGALKLNDNSKYHTVSNCVIRNCSAHIGGAVNGGYLVDCLCTNNYAENYGGVGSNTRFEKCRIAFNHAGLDYGVSYSHDGCLDTCFEGNTAGRNGGALLMGQRDIVSNCTFIANEASEGGALYCSSTSPVCIDCTFTGNVATNRGGAMRLTTGSYPKITGCVFVSNRVVRTNSTSEVDSHGGGAIFSLTSSEEAAISNCTFIGNSTILNPGGAVYNGVYVDCLFMSNQVLNLGASAYTPMPGGAGAFFTTGGVRRCTFIGNMVITNGNAGAVFVKAGVAAPVIDCAFTNNFAWTYGGAVQNATCSNCTFSGNMALYRGGAISQGTAVDCLFRDNEKRDMLGRPGTGTHYEYGGGSAYLSTLIRCDFTDGGFWKCSLTDCTIHDIKSQDIAPCVFYEENWATNCLVTGCNDLNWGMFYRYLYRPATGSDYRGAIRSSMVNCTFADNAVRKNGSKADGLFYGNGSYKTNDIDFVNCIFHNNKDKNGNVADLAGATCEVGVTLQNCIYGVSDGTLAWQDKGGNIVCADPMFAKNIRDGHYPYYMPKSGSPAIDAGLAQDWMSTASDLSGTNRVLGARVDIGCYESYIPAFGTVILFQ